MNRLYKKGGIFKKGVYMGKKLETKKRCCTFSEGKSKQKQRDTI